MFQPNQTSVAIAHRVERRTIERSSEMLVQAPRKPSPAMDSGITKSDEPLDLSKPMDLSRKYTEPTRLQVPQTYTAARHLVNGIPNRVTSMPQFGNGVEAGTNPKVSPLRSTKYPLQRGLAYVQPRKYLPSREAAIPDPRIPAVQDAKKALRKVVAPQQGQAYRNYEAMQQRVRTEAANIAALQAQAANAAQEAVKQAMARHAAATAANSKSQQPATGSPAHKVTQQQSAASSMFGNRRKQAQAGRMASVKPVQRKLTPDDLQSHVIERRLAQLSALGGLQTEQDVIRAYSQMMASRSTTSHAPPEASLTKYQPDIGEKPHVNGQSAPPKKPTGTPSTSASRDYAMVNARHNPHGRRIIDPHMVPGKHSDFAARVKAREQAMMKHHQELIVRKQRQLMKDVNKNRKLIELSEPESDRKVLMAEFNNKQYTNRLKVREQLEVMRYQTSPNPEYLKAVASYQAARINQSQRHSINSLPSSITKPEIRNVSGRDVLKRPSSGDIKSPPNSRPTSHLPEGTSASTLGMATKRPSYSSAQDSNVPRKIRVPPQYSELNYYAAAAAAAAEAQRKAQAQEIIYKSYKEGVEARSLLQSSSKKLSNVPVRDRLLLARMSERERQEFLLLSKYTAQLIEGQDMSQEELVNVNAGNRNATLSAETSSVFKELTSYEERRHHQGLVESMKHPHLKHNAQTFSQNTLTGNTTSSIGAATSNIKKTQPHAGYLKRDLPTQTPQLKPRTVSSTIQHPLARTSRLPSYDDAVAAQQSQDQEKIIDKLTPDVMSSVAKQLVSSSQKWLKKHLLAGTEPPRKGSNTLPAKSSESTHVGQGSLESTDASKKEQSTLSVDANQDNLQKEPKRNEQPISSVPNVPEVPPMPSSVNTYQPPRSTPLILDVLGLNGCKPSVPQVSQKLDKSKGSSRKPIIFGVPFSDCTTVATEASLPLINESLVSEAFLPLKKEMDQDTAKATSKPTQESHTSLGVFTRHLQEGEKSETTVVPSEDRKVDPAENDLMQADTASLGSEERALQRAILRQLSAKGPQYDNGSKEATGTKTGSIAQRRKRRKLSKFRRRNRHHHGVSSTTSHMPVKGRKRGRPRLSSLPPETDMASMIRNKFQDFVPTVLERRTRNSGSGRIRNYRSMYDTRNVRYELEIEKERAKVLERRRRLRESNNNVTGNTSATETDNDTTQDEDYAPVYKKPRGRPRSRDMNHAATTPSKKCENDDKHTVDASPTVNGDGRTSQSQPLRVVLDENSSNHIKMKFVNIRSMSSDGAPEVKTPSLQPRRRGRPPKAAGKCKTKRKNVGPPASPEPPKLEIVSPCEDKENDSDYEDYVKDPDYDIISPDITLPEYTRVIRPDPPQDMKKQLINNKLGETVLHRAASSGNMEILCYCVDYRVVEVNARDNAGYTALHDSCVEGHLDIAQYLLSHGADVNASAADGTRPIHDAIDNDQVEMVRLLLAYGADPFLATYTGRRTTKLALSKSSEMKTLLFGYLQDVNGGRSKLEDTPQHPLDYQWSFSGSCSLFDKNTSSDTYVYADVPGPEEVTKPDGIDQDEAMFFEISEKPVLPSFNIRLESHDKFRNWLLLTDVTRRLSKTSKELLSDHPELQPVTLSSCQFHQFVQESQVCNSALERTNQRLDDDSIDLEDKEEEVTLIELNDALRSILCVQVEYVR